MHLFKHRVWALLILLSIAGCDGPAPATVPLLTECEPTTVSNQISLGIGKDGFEAMESIDHALIVGGYQGGHHLWGAVRFDETTVLDQVKRLHLIVCEDDQIIAQALYASVDAVLRTQSELYGIPIVFASGVDVASLDGRGVSVLVGLETDTAPLFTHGTTDLKCCGHVADGD